MKVFLIVVGVGGVAVITACVLGIYATYSAAKFINDSGYYN